MKQHERKRAAILDAAIEAFLDKGFQATTMDAIAAHAGVSKRTVYNHFENKEALFKAILQALHLLAEEKVDFSYDANIAIDQQLTRIATEKIALIRDEHFRTLVRVLFAECIHSPELIAQAMQQLQEKESDLAAWIRSAIADGQLREVDTHYAAEQFYGLIKGVTFWPTIVLGSPMPDEQRCEQIIHDSVTMFLNYYRVDLDR